MLHEWTALVIRAHTDAGTEPTAPCPDVYGAPGGDLRIFIVPLSMHGPSRTTVRAVTDDVGTADLQPGSWSAASDHGDELRVLEDAASGTSGVLLW